jgi:FdhE protein
MPDAARTAAGELDARRWSDLLALGQHVLGGACTAHEAAAACFVIAAMQVAWARAAAMMNAVDAEPAAGGVRCPMCASPPVVSVVEAADSLHGTRFLICPLCSTRWHFVRIKCASCASTKGIAYQQIAGGNGAVKAETCDECRTYTKILYLEKDGQLEPLADDLASYALDVLVEQAGWRRATSNPFLMPIP